MRPAGESELPKLQRGLRPKLCWVLGGAALSTEDAQPPEYPASEDAGVLMTAGALGAACRPPVLALPGGFGRVHLPLGFQLLGTPFSEALLLDLGDAHQCDAPSPRAARACLIAAATNHPTGNRPAAITRRLPRPPGPTQRLRLAGFSRLVGRFA